MLIKLKDSIDSQLEQLDQILKIPDLPKDKFQQVQKELKILRSGNQGEQDSAYFIDFYYKDSVNWAIIHDLRIEYGGLTAQIDHLLINRFLDFYILETKNYVNGIKITDRGEFLVLFQNTYVPIESPLEQNKRHVKVLNDLLQGENLLPKRLGLSLQPHFIPYILVSPKSRVIRPPKQIFNTDGIIKSDEFKQQIEDNFKNENIFSTMGSVAKVISKDSLRSLAEHLVSHHRSLKINYYDRFSIAPRKTSTDISTPDPAQTIAPVIPSLKTASPSLTSKPSVQPEEAFNYYCYTCKKSISKKVAIFCFNHKVCFGGKAYCLDCQKQFLLTSAH